MRRSKLFIGVAAAAVVCASGAAQAARVGVFVGGAPYYWGPVAPAPYYWGPPPVIVAPPPQQPPDYIEQGQPQPGGPAQVPPGVQMPPDAQGPAGAPDDDPDAQADNGDTWYYCDASKTYYPYVKQCASGWREVPAQPATGN